MRCLELYDGQHAVAIDVIVPPNSPGLGLLPGMRFALSLGAIANANACAPTLLPHERLIPAAQKGALLSTFSKNHHFAA